MHYFVEVAGWLAAVLILISYVLITNGRINANSIAYQLMNVLGAVGFVINSGYKGALPSAVLNVIWMGIGLFALRRVYKAKRA